jgi:tight adherence protein B
MNPAWIRPMILVCIFAAVVLAAETLARWLAANRAGDKAINLRLKLIGRGHDRAEALSLLRRSGSAIPAGLPPFVERLGHKLERMLMQAQVTLPTPRLMLALLVAPIAVFFLLMLLMIFWWGMSMSPGRLVITITFAAVLGTVLPLLVLNFKATRTRKKMEEQFPVALDVFVRGLRAGHPIAAALDLLTVEMPDPIGSQFGIAVDEVTYGAELRDALQSMADRWEMEDMRMFVVSLSVQSETGGNLAEILENLSKVVRERHSMMLKVRALSSEGRMTATMLTILPVFAFVVLFLFSPRFLLDVANDPWFIPVFGILIFLYLTGFFIMRRMVDLKV